MGVRRLLPSPDTPPPQQNWTPDRRRHSQSYRHTARRPPKKRRPASLYPYTEGPWFLGYTRVRRSQVVGRRWCVSLLACGPMRYREQAPTAAPQGGRRHCAAPRALTPPSFTWSDANPASSAPTAASERGAPLASFIFLRAPRLRPLPFLRAVQHQAQPALFGPVCPGVVCAAQAFCCGDDGAAVALGEAILFLLRNVARALP